MPEPIKDQPRKISQNDEVSVCFVRTSALSQAPFILDRGERKAYLKRFNTMVAALTEAGESDVIKIPGKETNDFEIPKIRFAQMAFDLRMTLIRSGQETAIRKIENFHHWRRDQQVHALFSQ